MDVAIVCVGNSPNLNNKWMSVSDTGEGREGVDRQIITLGSGQVERPVQELRGFRRVAIRPGETRTVELPLPAKSLANWDTNWKAFVVEPDTVEISVGVSSADEKLKTRGIPAVPSIWAPSVDA